MLRARTNSLTQLTRAGLRAGLLAAFLTASLFAAACASACLSADFSALAATAESPARVNHCGDSSSTPPSDPAPASHDNNCLTHAHPNPLLTPTSPTKISLTALDSNSTPTLTAPTFFSPASPENFSRTHAPPGNTLPLYTAFSILRI